MPKTSNWPDRIPYPQYRDTVGGRDIDEGRSPAPLAKCPHCSETCVAADCDTTWQQWRCYCCGAWNDREETT
jgi:hypothetical protein